MEMTNSTGWKIRKNCFNITGKNTNVCFYLEETDDEDLWYFTDEGIKYFEEIKEPPILQSDKFKPPNENEESCRCKEGSVYGSEKGKIKGKMYKVWWCSEKN